MGFKLKNNHWGRLQASNHDVCQQQGFSNLGSDNQQSVVRGIAATPNNSV